MLGVSRISFNRFAALLLLVVACVGLGFGVAYPLLVEINDTKKALAQESSMIAKLRSRAAALETEIDALPVAQNGAPIWGGGSVRTINAKFQSAIQRVAIKERLSLTAMNVGQSITFAGGKAVELNLETQAPYDLAVQFLQALEDHDPVMVVDRAAIRVVKAGANASLQPIVQMRLTVIAPFVADIEGVGQ